jgi:hypothetical protein
VLVFDGLDQLAPAALARLIATMGHMMRLATCPLKLFLTSCDRAILAQLRTPELGAHYTVALRHWSNQQDGYGSHIWSDMEKVLMAELGSGSPFVDELVGQSQGSYVLERSETLQTLDADMVADFYGLCHKRSYKNFAMLRNLCRMILDCGTSRLPAQ